MLWDCHLCHCGGADAAMKARPHRWTEKLWGQRGLCQENILEDLVPTSLRKDCCCIQEDAGEHHLRETLNSVGKLSD